MQCRRQAAQDRGDAAEVRCGQAPALGRAVDGVKRAPMSDELERCARDLADAFVAWSRALAKAQSRPAQSEPPRPVVSEVERRRAGLSVVKRSDAAKLLGIGKRTFDQLIAD